MSAEVKFSIPVPTLDALRRIVRRDFERDRDAHQRELALPEKQRDQNVLRALLRHEGDRDQVERALGFQADKDEVGRP